ncbi:twin-arginine translocation signal domain-containing protein [Paractinoplanes globisporus]|uniref:Twin-arginine translocation signal domain-containing protein n=1 Tax=Paractinoplanes globisporus TaxID=113565 RepID=A0ABW6WEJ0_9ACTN|nr:twin-arginine translocation signal domain-containing protein [Actinoplanes globisporus]
MTQLDRRQFLKGSAAVGVVGFTQAAPGETVTRTLSGSIAYGAPDWVYIPLEIPSGVNRASTGR